MRLMRVILLWLLGLGWSVSAVLAGEPVAQTPGARLFRVAVVDTGFKASWRDELNQQFCERFKRAVERSAGVNFVVRTEAVTARTAATRLTDGACDAVMILGGERPRAFWRIELPAIAVTMNGDRNFESAYLIVAGGDAGLRQALGAALAMAVITPRSARSLGKTSDSLVLQ